MVGNQISTSKAKRSEEFTKQLHKINYLLMNGQLPDELNYTKSDNQEVIDLSKVKYNAFYRSYEFVESTFPKGCQNIPYFDKVIESIVEQIEEQNITPLSEITKRSSIDKDEQ